MSPLLLVDDDPSSLHALESALAPLGHPLVKASSGKEAIEHLLHAPFTLILLAVTMPSLEGFETARLIQQRTLAPHPPILFLGTSAPEVAHLRQAYALGAVDYLVRPFDADLLRTKVSALVELAAARQHATEQLRFQESILQHAQDSIIVTDLSGHITHWSQGAEALFGYTASEMRGQTVQRLYPEQDTSALAQDLTRILEGQDYAGEWRGRRKDGTALWVDVRTSLMRDGGGKAVGFIGVSRDITARRRAEQRLRFLSDAGRLLMEGTDDVDALLRRVAQLATDSLADICSVDLVQEDGTLRRLSIAHRKSLPEPLIQQSLRFPPRLDSQSPLVQALRSGKTLLFADFVPLRQQAAQSAEHLQLIEALDVRSTLVVTLQSQGRALGLLSLSVCAHSPSFDQDDLELAEELARRVMGSLETRSLFREAQAALLQAEKEKRTAEILSRVGLAFASELDRDKLVQRVTDEATELTGAAFGAFFHNLVNDKGESYLLYTLSGVPREAFSRFPMPRNTRIFAPTFEGKRTMRLDDVTQSAEYGHNPPHHGMPAGHLPVRSYLAVPVKSRSGQVLGGLFFGHPEPGRFRQEHEHLVEGLAAQAAVALDNALLYRQAQLAASLRDEFLQVAAHELRTPTTSLTLNVQSLLRAAKETGAVLSPEKLRARLEGVERSAGKLNVLVSELLDISRITSGSLHLAWEEVDLSAVVREVASRFEAQAAQAHAPIHVAADGPLVGRWDRLRLEQIVTNLLSNALKYGAGHPVAVDTRVIGAHAQLTVRDEGIGIAPEALPRIFGRFERAVSERHYGGLGLGLYITRQIVVALGGTVHVESLPGQGATFTVELPLSPPGSIE
ncbi:MAG: GAF domain-containing protein [Hyalangium sp.]|uniref:GAF domain-containing protein n=1 Tax=Hyalangium sp. TaxID=2028555 RepID=UPI00389ABA64